MSARLVLTIILLLGSSVAMMFAQPAIHIGDGKKFDFGTILRGTVVDHKVTIQNTGNEPLVLGEIEASCGCTGTLLSQKEVRPGGTGTLSISFNSRNFTGAVHKTVAVHSNASNQPRLVIEFSAQVIDEILITPAHLWFKDAEVKRKSRVVLAVRNNGKEVLRLTGWRCALGGITVTLPAEAIAQGESAEIVAEFTPSKAAPILSDGMFLETSNPRQPEVFVPIYGNAREFKFE